MKDRAAGFPVRLEANGVCMQGHYWGDMDVARVRVPAGGDLTPLLKGLPDDLCHCPHWGTLLQGSVHVRYADGQQETVRAGEAYYWPPGHTAWTDEGYEAFQISPQVPMQQVLEHFRVQLGLS